MAVKTNSTLGLLLTTHENQSARYKNYYNLFMELFKGLEGRYPTAQNTARREDPSLNGRLYNSVKNVHHWLGGAYRLLLEHPDRLPQDMLSILLQIQQEVDQLLEPFIPSITSQNPPK